MAVANFFWHGSDLSLYERVSLKSFVKHNFVVNIYSFHKLSKIEGVNNLDAREILPEESLYKYTHNNKNGCLAAFSDEFRIFLMKKKCGWWFDIDIICLKDASEFDNLDNNKKILVGYECEDNIANGILKINDQTIIEDIINKIKLSGTKFNWGTIGPKLIKDIIIEKNIQKEVFKQNIFFPINYTNFYYLFMPEKLNNMKLLFRNSYTCHFYNEILSRFSYPKNVLPPKGSFVYNLFLENDKNLLDIISLPVDTFLRLVGKKSGSTSFSEHVVDLWPSFLRLLKNKF
jgi:hypothetical protein